MIECSKCGSMQIEQTMKHGYHYLRCKNCGALLDYNGKLTKNKAILMTGKRFVDYFDKDHNYIIHDLINKDEYQVGFVNCDEDEFLELVNKLVEENEKLKSTNMEMEDYLLRLEEENKDKPFFKIVDDYTIEYDGDYFNLHRPSHIRSLIHIINRANGYSELQCEYNDLTIDGDSDE